LLGFEGVHVVALNSQLLQLQLEVVQVVLGFSQNHVLSFSVVADKERLDALVQTHFVFRAADVSLELVHYL
jgi:hypothetical protein